MMCVCVYVSVCVMCVCMWRVRVCVMCVYVTCVCVHMCVITSLCKGRTLYIFHSLQLLGKLLPLLNGNRFLWEIIVSIECNDSVQHLQFLKLCKVMR